jgi:hypothetical protein
VKLPAMKEIVEERKGRAVESLSASFAENRLPLEEYERLVEYINKIESERELIVVEKMVAEYGGSAAPGGKAAGGRAARDDDDDDETGPDCYRGGGRQNLTILSSRTFAGPLPPGAQFVSILGSEQIKIRREDLRRRRTTVQVVSILGDSVIFVEPGIRVINAAVPVLGSAWTTRGVERQAEADAPELVISGAALLGNITVKLIKE